MKFTTKAVLLLLGFAVGYLLCAAIAHGCRSSGVEELINSSITETTDSPLGRDLSSLITPLPWLPNPTS